MKVVEVEQRSTDWWAWRLGRLTSSCAADMLATIRTGEAAARRNLRVRLVLERLTGQSMERSFQSQAMADGIEREPVAVALYEAMTGTLLRSVGFVAHDTLMAGYSPDGVRGTFEGLAEFKCPIPATHLEYVKTGKVPEEYRRQITHALWITGAPWCDWMSFQPLFPESLRARLVRVHRKDVDIDGYDRAARAFLNEVETELHALLTLANPRAVLKAAAGVA